MNTSNLFCLTWCLNRTVKSCWFTTQLNFQEQVSYQLLTAKKIIGGITTWFFFVLLENKRFKLSDKLLNFRDAEGTTREPGRQFPPYSCWLWHCISTHTICTLQVPQLSSNFWQEQTESISKMTECYCIHLGINSYFKKLHKKQIHCTF